MIRLHVLSPGFTNPNSMGFLFPFYKFRAALREAGVEVRIFTRPSPALGAADALLVEGKFFAQKWAGAERESSLDMLRAWARQTRLVWCDQSDSTGTLQPHVMPIVHGYAKAQMLRETQRYLTPLHGGRLYTDYYHRQFGVQDEKPYEDALPRPEDLNKLRLSWNSGLMHYGRLRPAMMAVWPYAPLQPFIPFAGKLADPGGARPLGASCRMGISYPRASVRWQRERMRVLLQGYVQSNKVSHGQYMQELCRSKICLSPFGYGEITLKDFEAFLCGAALLKPDMDHMQTWPDFFEKGVTYAAHRWDLTDLPGIIEEWLRRPQDLTEIARQGQQRYLDHTCGPEAGALFAGRLRDLALGV